MKKYMTSQRKILLEYLSRHHDRQISAKQIEEDLRLQGISLSAVYRNLSDLENENLVKRCTKGGKREVYYQYVAAESCKNALHLTCKICGRTTHMSADTTSDFCLRLLASDGFEVDKSETIIYGVCKNCRQEKKIRWEKNNAFSSIYFDLCVSFDLCCAGRNVF